MDSGNASSLHSSSGGGGGGSDDVDSLSAFFHTSASASVVTLPPPPSLSSVGPHFFDYSPLFYLDSSSSFPSTLLPSASGSQPSAAAVGPQTDPPPALAPAPRSSRKRSRATRRAPTTVLTTDTSNFRAMVQEFTGIPAAPFAVPAAASSPFLRSRIDQLLHSSSSATAAAASPFLLGPFSHKPHSSPPFPIPIRNTPPLPPSLTLTIPASVTVTAGTNSNSNQLTPNLHSLLQPPTPATFFASDDFAALPQPPQAAIMLPDPAPSSWATVQFSGAGVSQPLIGAAGSCKPSYSSSAEPAAELVIREKKVDSEIARKAGDGEADPSWIHSLSD
ncbi:mucin-2-like [Zingiber officinale]|uniref:mucin-2-like n=1 Tax=Zingiber officinale TaxID=94328 RepID=UPI001C4AD4EE|nr:mucin-2-like [Zingiber officinale]